MTSQLQNPAVSPSDVPARNLRDIVGRVLWEDIGRGDETTRRLIKPGLRAQGTFVARSAGVVAGWEIVREVFAFLTETIMNLDILVRDGERCKPGEKLATLEGEAAVLLSGERTALNLLQRMSGIATRTAEFVKEVRGTSAVILDTRKTAPGLRLLDKMAVRIGGGQNHRFGLDDMILIKENHIAVCGTISEAISRARKNRDSAMKIEVEVRDLEELTEAVAAAPDRILLDNMDLTTIQKAVNFVKNRVPLEVSGNVSLGNVRKIAETGVQFISVGQLTHSVQALDISFNFTSEKS